MLLKASSLQIGDYLGRHARARFERTAEMHNRLVGGDNLNPAFQPEPFSDHYRRALYHGLAQLDRPMF